jgi:hypothetical protein
VVQGIVAVAALIIVVVFRNEIRSILQARNLKGILWGFPKRPLGTPQSGCQAGARPGARQ